MSPWINLKLSRPPNVDASLNPQCRWGLCHRPRDQSAAGAHGHDHVEPACHLQKLLWNHCAAFPLWPPKLHHEAGNLDLRWKPGRCQSSNDIQWWHQPPNWFHETELWQYHVCVPTRTATALIWVTSWRVESGWWRTSADGSTGCTTPAAQTPLTWTSPTTSSCYGCRCTSSSTSSSPVCSSPSSLASSFTFPLIPVWSCQSYHVYAKLTVLLKSQIVYICVLGLTWFCNGCYRNWAACVHIWLCSWCVGLPHYSESLCAVMSESGPPL